MVQMVTNIVKIIHIQLQVRFIDYTAVEYFHNLKATEITICSVIDSNCGIFTNNLEQIWVTELIF